MVLGEKFDDWLRRYIGTAPDSDLPESVLGYLYGEPHKIAARRSLLGCALVSFLAEQCQNHAPPKMD